MIHINTGFDLDAVYNNEEARRKKLAEQEAAKARQELLKGKIGTRRQPAQPPAPPIPTTGNGGLIEKASNGVYLYANVPYAGIILPGVEFTTNPLDGGKSHTQADWSKHQDPDGRIVPDAELLYQFMHRNYLLRNDTTPEGKLAQEITQQLRQNYDSHYLMTLTNIKYGKTLDAQVTRLKPLIGQLSPTTITIPEFTKHDKDWSYAVLAQEQPDTTLGTNCTPQNAQPVLATLLGANNNEAPSVFQYTASRKDGQLRETRLWTPTATNRNAERVVCLGVYINDRFDLSASGNFDGNWPALGVRPLAPKFSSGNKGA